MSQLFAQVAKVLEFQFQHQSLQMNTQGWFPLGLAGLISLLFKESHALHQFGDLS